MFLKDEVSELLCLTPSLLLTTILKNGEISYQSEALTDDTEASAVKCIKLSVAAYYVAESHTSYLTGYQSKRHFNMAVIHLFALGCFL